MTATATRPVPTTTATECPAPSLWRKGAVAGVIAAASTVAVAGAAQAIDIPLQSAPGETVPILGFGQLTLVFTLVGVLIARSIDRRCRRPRATLAKVTIALTALSLVPDMMLDAGTATKVTFVLTHLVAAAIVIPALSSAVRTHGAR
jgi:peptidoglycan/LPS O-acetylase OafA/YrhL